MNLVYLFTGGKWVSVQTPMQNINGYLECSVENDSETNSSPKGKEYSSLLSMTTVVQGKEK